MQTFVFGHKNPDTDSIISAIAQAAFLKEMGVAAEACALGAPNPETLFVLDKFGLPAPEMLELAAGKNVFITDTNDPNQLPADIDAANITGIVDHHQLSGGIKTPGPIYMTMRPFGCTCTIIAQNFVNAKIPLSKELAGAMLCAILSDTLLFKSPTSTPTDKETAQMLAVVAELDMMVIGMEMLRVKSDISNETAASLLHRDLKEFDINGKKFAVAQIELMDSAMAAPFMEGLKAEMSALKKSKNLNGVIMVVTDTMKEGSELLLETDMDDKIRALFGNTDFIPGLMSRKKQVIPVLMDNL
ncbi:MAG: manganese-dependent inorganic pyrophosphatase [Rickettsiales bacterium]|jgi:manganese-dependent inorganic pyrophosphatase|nr:manganese-dependent inorganic pyrophosphatase [Rickettsiales bacterium]